MLSKRNPVDKSAARYGLSANKERAPLPRLDVALNNASDLAFRTRAVAEYERVLAWVKDQIDLNDARIMDFGCGQGIATASFALRHPRATVIGFDIHPVDLDHLSRLMKAQINYDLPANLQFDTPKNHQIPKGEFDLILAWSVFNHVSEHQMIETFAELKTRLRPHGVLFLQISPLYFSPEGSLLYKYFRSPWHHLQLPLDMLREGVFTKGMTETQTREWQQFLALNRLTAADILGRASAAGLKRIKSLCSKTNLVPPPRLTRLYNADALMTTEVTAIFE
jgi:2-polyprenyl-3-methyl-5-hydroxy-6-metoxy-1,4-benzoquinol methylase